MRSFLFLMLSLWLSTSALAATVPETSQLKQALEEAKAAKTSPAQAEQVQSLEAALNTLSERDASLTRAEAEQYQQVIDNFPRLVRELRQQIASLDDGGKSVRGAMSSAQLNQEILQVSSQLLEEGRQAHQEQDCAREISDLLSQLPQQQTDTRRAMNESDRRLQNGAAASPWAQQAENALNKARVDALELEQLSANNRQELAHTEQLAENSGDLPPAISDQFRVNRDLSSALNQQAQRMDLVASQQWLATNQIIQVRQALCTLHEQVAVAGRLQSAQ
nr:miniconductance mechanosensitive channel MscM [Candidatus Pantoea persica]